jgi:fatty aldehyde-generating acyl-ACP reductase
MKRSFAFLIHARYLEDVYKKFPILKILPEGITLWLLKKMPPVFISEIKGLRDKDGDEIKGYIGRMPMITHQMVEDRKVALEKMKDAVKVLSKKKINLIGLGGLNASLSRGGLDLVETFKNLNFTTGRTYTAKIVTDYVKNVIDEFGFNKSEVKIAIIGGAGSIGSGCAEILARWQLKNFLVIDLERKLDILVKRVNQIHSMVSSEKIFIKVSHKISDIKWADIIIAATSAPEAVIKEYDLKSGAIIINDAQPSDVSPEVYTREDVLVIEGGVIKTPGVRIGINLGLTEKDDSFCCLGEAMILAHENLYYVEKSFLDYTYLEKLSKTSEKLNFGITKYQNKFGYIDEEKINKIKKILNKNK